MDPMETLAVQITRIEGKLDVQASEMAHIRQSLSEWKQDLKQAINEGDDELRESIAALKSETTAALDDKVSKDDFGPVKAIVFGLVGLILTAVVGALIALVVPGVGG